MNDMGWKRTKEKTDENFRLKWTELKSAINYNSFREGQSTAPLLVKDKNILELLCDYVIA